MGKSVVDREAAQVAFNQFLEASDFDDDRSEWDEGILELERCIVRDIERGALSVGAGGELYIHVGEETHPFKYLRAHDLSEVNKKGGDDYTRAVRTVAVSLSLSFEQVAGWRAKIVETCSRVIHFLK